MKMLFHSLDLKFREDDPRAHDAEIVAAKMDHLNKIVDQLLGFARSNEPTLELVDINELLDDVLLLARQKLRQQHVALKKNFAQDLPEIRADRGQIEQACLNLILNATEAMPNGGTLSVATGVVGRVPSRGATAPATSGDVAYNDISSVVISFTDTGVGMSPDRQRQLFEPFLTTKTRGTGLGLALVQRIIEAHHGRIEVQSALKKGTTFRLLLPVQRA
jgi:signal transduction histidine kinase